LHSLSVAKSLFHRIPRASFILFGIDSVLFMQLWRCRSYAHEQIWQRGDEMKTCALWTASSALWSCFVALQGFGLHLLSPLLCPGMCHFSHVNLLTQQNVPPLKLQTTGVEGYSHCTWDHTLLIIYRSWYYPKLLGQKLHNWTSSICRNLRFGRIMTLHSCQQKDIWGSFMMVLSTQCCY
jgi:hypothetical protein